MNKLISAEALLLSVRDDPEIDGKHFARIKEHIGYAPDAVKHGRWKDRYGGKYANPVYDCSECKKPALFRNDMDLLGNWKSVQYLSDYCPNCGARMDGGNEDG